jgi:hypothetical protein
MVRTMIYIKKDKVKSNDECPIYIKILFKNESITISTAKYISEERWIQTDNLRRKLRQEREKVLKEFLDLYVLKIEKIYNQIVKYQEDISISEFKLMILGKHI